MVFERASAQHSVRVAQLLADEMRLVFCAKFSVEPLTLDIVWDSQFRFGYQNRLADVRQQQIEMFPKRPLPKAHRPSTMVEIYVTALIRFDSLICISWKWKWFAPSMSCDRMGVRHQMSIVNYFDRELNASRVTWSPSTGLWQIEGFGNLLCKLLRNSVANEWKDFSETIWPSIVHTQYGQSKKYYALCSLMTNFRTYNGQTFKLGASHKTKRRIHKIHCWSSLSIRLHFPALPQANVRPHHARDADACMWQ